MFNPLQPLTAKYENILPTPCYEIYQKWFTKGGMIKRFLDSTFLVSRFLNFKFFLPRMGVFLPFWDLKLRYAWKNCKKSALILRVFVLNELSFLHHNLVMRYYGHLTISRYGFLLVFLLILLLTILPLYFRNCINRHFVCRIQMVFH